MGKESEEPEFTREQEILNENYKRFTANAISNLHNFGRIPSTDEIIFLTEFLKKNRNVIESPLYDTCMGYYDEGCDSTQVEFLFNLILSGIFGASMGLLFSTFIFIPFYGIYALIAVLACLGLGITYTFYKKYRKQV